MSYASEAALREHVIRQCRREGDGKFLAEWPRMLDKAEQRMMYGSGDPMPTPKVRVRGLEATATVAFVAGVGPLPVDYMQARSLRFEGVPVAVPGYCTPEDFDAAYVVLGGKPIIYSVRGDSIEVKPAYSGDGRLYYYKRLAAATDGANWIMTNAPSLYEHACLYEAYRFLRNPEQATLAMQDYVAAVNGLMVTDGASRSMGTLRPRIPNSRILRQ